MTTTLSPGPSCTLRGFGIDLRLGAVATRSTAASRKDVSPHPSSNSGLKIASITGSTMNPSLTTAITKKVHNVTK